MKLLHDEKLAAEALLKSNVIRARKTDDGGSGVAKKKSKTSGAGFEKLSSMKKKEQGRNGFENGPNSMKKKDKANKLPPGQTTNAKKKRKEDQENGIPRCVQIRLSI